MKSLAKTFLLILFVCAIGAATKAQDPDNSWRMTILKKDSAFWTAYNSCDTTQIKNFFTDDVEFYHDKGGITIGNENLSLNMKKYLCKGEFRLRREEVKGSVKLYSLKNNNVVYGAILSGQHYFYQRPLGKPEYLDGLARFTHVWILKENVWKMSRVLSFDHGPANK